MTKPIKCQRCKQLISPNEFEFHQAHGHDQGGVYDRNNPDYDGDWDDMDVGLWPRNLDASKNIGYPCREDGRYGSYPSHDGFDDESNS
ncbi:MAG TPA: hypothetical protein PLK77_16035 [Pyrinomonadaceae bacterium]|nr:hypothetical protein [Pyrinomonadaceae bacterium]